MHHLNAKSPAAVASIGAGALAYAARLGWRVFPCIGKLPIVKAWLTAATTDELQIQRWWRNQPDANVGIVTGHDFWALDVDDDDGEEALSELERWHGPLPQTVEQLTGGGGRQLFFKTTEKIRNRTGILPSVDVRGDGGFVIVPPSVHPETKRKYAWSVDGHTFATRLEPAPEWLLALARKSGSSGGKAPVGSLDQQIPEGKRNDTLARITGILLRKYVAPDVAAALIRALNLTRCAPPLPSEEVEKILESVAGLELRRRGARQ